MYKKEFNIFACESHFKQLQLLILKLILILNALTSAINLL